MLEKRGGKHIRETRSKRRSTFCDRDVKCGSKRKVFQLDNRGNARRKNHRTNSLEVISLRNRENQRKIEKGRKTQHLPRYRTSASKETG